MKHSGQPVPNMIKCLKYKEQKGKLFLFSKSNQLYPGNQHSPNAFTFTWRPMWDAVQVATGPHTQPNCTRYIHSEESGPEGFPANSSWKCQLTDEVRRMKGVTGPEVCPVKQGFWERRAESYRVFPFGLWNYSKRSGINQYKFLICLDK